MLLRNSLEGSLKKDYFLNNLFTKSSKKIFNKSKIYKSVYDIINMLLLTAF